MRNVSATSAQQFFKALLTPWRITAILMGLFFLGQGYLTWRNRAVEAALEGYAPFATPAFELEFSKNFSYDPLSFVGRGRRAGFWDWTPEGLVLTEEGRKFFEESGDKFVSRAAAGARRIKRIRTNQEREGERHVEFLYEWAEVSPPAAALVVPPPQEEEEYPGQAVLVREGGAWKVKSFRARDFEEPMAHLREIASGVLR